MEKVYQPFISEAAQYGLAFIVMAIVIIAFGYAVVSLWKVLLKEMRANREVIQENTVAFRDLQNLINSRL